MDANEDVQNSDIKEALSHLSLQEAILAKHGNDAPSIYNKGWVQIDGIFVTPTLHISKGGYLPHGQHVPTNHQGL